MLTPTTRTQSGPWGQALARASPVVRRRNRTPANIAGVTSAALWSKPVDLKVWLALSSRQFLSLRYQCGQCGWPHQGAGPRLISCCNANSKLADRVDLPPRYRCPLNRLPASRLLLPRSGLERSDFVPWPLASFRGDAECWSLSGHSGPNPDLPLAQSVANDPGAEFGSQHLSVELYDLLRTLQGSDSFLLTMSIGSSFVPSRDWRACVELTTVKREGF